MKNTFGQKIKELRKGKKLNQTQMAEILGVHLQTICRYEKGKLTPSPDVLSVLAEKFGVDANWLFEEGDRSIFIAPGELGTPLSIMPGGSDSDKHRRLWINKLNRIFDEGNEDKVTTVKGMLRAFDPGGKTG